MMDGLQNSEPYLERVQDAFSITSGIILASNLISTAEINIIRLTPYANSF